MENETLHKSWPTRLIEGVAVALLTLLVILVTAQVFMRYVMRSPLVWSEEMARMSFVWFSFIGAGLGFRYHQDLRVAFFTDFLPLRARLYLRLVIHLIEVIFMGLILYNGWFLLERLYPTPSPALYWSMDTFYGGVVGGGFVILCYALMRFKQTIDALRQAGRSK